MSAPNQTEQGWNPRFVIYAATHGRTPEAQLQADGEQYPGGRMAGFICWISRGVAGFKRAQPASFCGTAIRDHDAFTRWLAAQGGDL